MLDLKQQILKCSISQEQASSMVVENNSDINNGGHNCDLLKRCVHCQTSTTPLWRGGPAGPKSLCNACGIKYHKKRRALLGIGKSKMDKTKKNNKPSSTTITPSATSGSSSGSTTSNGGGGGGNYNNSLKIKIMTSGINRQRHNLEREVEQAALLLMTLSYGFGYVYS